MKYFLYRIKFLYSFLKNKKKKYNFPAWAFFPEKKIGYLVIPKVACSSLRITLAEIKGEIHQDDIPKYFRKKSLKQVDNLQDYFTFAFVRNPFARLASCYKDKVIPNKTGSWNLESYLGGFIYRSSDFYDFIKRINAIPEEIHESHFASQYNQIYKKEMGGGAKIVPNFIGKFENLENDWRFLQEKFNLGDLPHINATKKDDWRDYYDIKTAKLVYKIYKKDFETFGYEDEYQKLLEYLNKKQNE